MECTKLKLHNFSLKHYTFINQIFGDMTVRSIISEVFPNDKYYFDVEEANDDFDNNSDHHILRRKTTNKSVCSVKQGYQNLLKNKNDTLCQSYSLMTYFGIKISPIRKKRQQDMCNMYRKILSNKEFLKILDEDILQVKANKNLWLNYANKKTTEYLNMDIQYIRRSILNVLKTWEEFGYMYFMDEGECR